MSLLLSWRQEWCTGVDWIDRDHLEMGHRLNRLAHACRWDAEARGPAGEPPNRVWALACLDALLEHCSRHFAAEESFLRGIEFPGIAEHSREHSMQHAELTQLRRALEEQPGSVLGPEAIAELKRWFLDHIVAEDRDYADYYRAWVANERHAS